MSATLDVNVLVYAADETATRHAQARALLEHVATNPSITYLFWPVLLGYVRIITHPAIVAAPLSPETALADIDDLIARPQIIVAGEGDRFWSGFKSVVRSVQPRGALVPDGHLVALMREHGVAQIWSNDRDFRKFDGISALNPFDDRYSAGFE
ncbi:MAG: PIN domain-containing protein [Actinomycetota bacterium]|nr:PIN domain-containing protein [Actinomycetota bacterium]